MLNEGRCNRPPSGIYETVRWLPGLLRRGRRVLLGRLTVNQIITYTLAIIVITRLFNVDVGILLAQRTEL